MTVDFARRALADYARRPLNLVLLVAVPAVMVLALQGQLASFSKLLSTVGKPTHLQVATAGWAAAVVAGLAGFFQVVGSRGTDRRLAAVSTGAVAPVVAGRLLASGVLAVAAGAASMAALALRGGIADPARAVPTILVVAVIYTAIGVLAATVVRSEMNGALVVTTIVLLDVFVGSGLGGSSSMITRFFPLHFPTMILTSQAANHGGPLGDVGWTVIWAVGLVALAVARLATTTRPPRRARRAAAITAHPDGVASTMAVSPGRAPAPVDRSEPPASAATGSRRMPTSRTGAGLLAAVRQYRRDRVLWALLVIVPVAFIGLAAAETPTKPMPVTLLDASRRFTAMVSLRHIHGAEMASIAAALLAGVAGLFVVTGSATGDRRLALAGFRPRHILAGHLGVVAGAAVVTSAVSLAVSAFFLSPRSWVEYAGAALLVALTYAMIGVLLGPLTGRLGGLYLLLLASIVDVGYGQTVMFHPTPPAWGAFLPARGAGRLLLDGAFTPTFEQYGYLLLALLWLAVLSGAALIVFKRQIGLHPVTHLAMGTFARIDTASSGHTRPARRVARARTSVVTPKGTEEVIR